MQNKNKRKGYDSKHHIKGKKKMKLENKRGYLGEKGITLIALVVTIVVLLILAGVSVNAIFNENGLIKKAQEAQSKMDEAKNNDLKTIDELTNLIDNQVNGTSSSVVATPETWVLNDAIPQWTQEIECSINFTSNGQQFTKIKITTDKFGGNLYYDEQLTGMGGPVASGGMGITPTLSYRELTFETAPTGELLAWLQANATKQE